jgi:ATP synthase protein I
MAGPPCRRHSSNNSNQINEVTGCDLILTCLNAVSMVRAAFKGDGRNFHPPLASFRVLGMAEDKNDNASGKRDQPSSDEAALSARLGSLDQRLSEIRDSRKLRTDQPGTESGDRAARTSAMALGFRLSSELVAGVVVGAAIGWGFDRLLSTSPFGFIVFLLLGFVAGVVNVVRTAGAGPGRR